MVATMERYETEQGFVYKLVLYYLLFFIYSFAMSVKIDGKWENDRGSRYVTSRWALWIIDLTLCFFLFSLRFYLMRRPGPPQHVRDIFSLCLLPA